MGLLDEKQQAEPPAGGKARARIAAIAVLVLLGAAGSVWLWRRGAHPADSETARTRRPHSVDSRPAKARPAPPSPGEGRVEVQASVTAARVSVDGVERGTAPLSLALRPGPHTIRVEREGLQPFEREVQVIPGRTLQLAARLEPPAPRLRVDSDIPGASVFLDRRAVGKAPLDLRDVAPGTHRLTVTAEGHEMWSETIEVTAGSQEVNVRFKEVRLDEALEVSHKHAMGSCRGRLLASTEGLRYEAGEAKDAFQEPLAAFEPLHVDYLKKNLRLKRRGGRTWNFTADSADALLGFQRAVEAARKRLQAP